MIAPLDTYRRFYAEEIETAAGLRTPALVEALATVPREQFLGPGPWTIKGADGDIFGAPRQTPDADPVRVSHNVAVAIDPARQLFNGQPGTITVWIDQLALEPGSRVLHVGSATGYYTALMAYCVAPAGHIVAYEVDEGLAARARDNLASDRWRTSSGLPDVDVRHGDATKPGGPFDAILVNAGATHPLDVWLDALAPGGRLVVPITYAFGGTPITKGLVVLIARRGDAFDARTIGFVAIYAAAGVRHAALNDQIGAALKTNPMPRLTALRRDPHERNASCWLHGESFCLEAGASHSSR